MDFASLGWPTMAAQGTGALLVLARIGGVCATAPVLSAPGLDWRFRIVLALVLSVLLVPIVGPLVGPVPSWPRVAWAGLTEILVGGLLGWSAALIVAGARQAGEIVAAQSGLSAAALFDPDTGNELTALGHLYGLVALAVFLALDGPLVVVESLVESYHKVPVGSLLINEDSVTLAFAQVGQALALALRAAAPPAVALALAGMLLGWLGRLAPAVPFVTLSLPARAFLGIALVVLGLSALALTFSQAWSSWPWGQ